jgi:DNA-binding CsgD family transcriptional regulator
VFLDIPSYGTLPKEMQKETLVRFEQGADTRTIASELEVHESRIYNHLARVRS